MMHRVKRLTFANMKTLIKKWAIGFALLVGFVFGLMWFGDAFRANMLLFALLWVATPISACSLSLRSVSASFTIAGLRRVQGVLMAVAIAISFAMFAHDDQVRNRIGTRFVEGYTYWRAEPEIDDYGRPYYPGDDWTAKNRSGRWGLQLFGLALLAAVFGLPAVTWKATNAAIYKKEAECLFTADGKRVETYESNA